MTINQEELHHLSREYSRYALQFSAYIFYGPANGEAHNDAINNASITLVRLNGRQFGITNSHVIDGYRNRVAKEKLICQIGNCVIDPLRLLISEDRLLDLAVLDLSDIQIDKVRGGKEIPCQFYEPRHWPTISPTVGEFVLFGGFPGCRRIEKGKDHFSFGSVSSGGTEVHSVQHDVITCQMELEKCVVSFDYDGRGFDQLPGISGSPVLIARKLNSGFIVFDLIGIVFEYEESMDVLRIRPAMLINSDGTILRP